MSQLIVDSTPGANVTRPVLVAALLLLGFAAPTRADSKHFLWRISKGSGTLYLVGSVHVLRPSDYPLPEVMEHDFDDSAELVEELDLTRLDPELAQSEMLQLGTYRQNHSLKEALPPYLYRRLVNAAAMDSLSMDTLNRLKPWLVSILLLDAQLLHAGYASTDGVDEHFAQEAKAVDKPVMGLEQPAYQLELFAKLPDATQLALLKQSLDERVGFDTEMRSLLADWHSGDTIDLAREMQGDFGKYPDIYQSLLVIRNHAWVPKLEALLATGKRYFVVVGAMHLVGPDGLLACFKKDGYAVEQL